MSVSKWAYDPDYCDGDICVGDCDYCNKIVTMYDDALDACKKEIDDHEQEEKLKAWLERLGGNNE